MFTKLSSFSIYLFFLQLQIAVQKYGRIVIIQKAALHIYNPQLLPVEVRQMISACWNFSWVVSEREVAAIDSSDHIWKFIF
jgi:hypothetical protein